MSGYIDNQATNEARGNGKILDPKWNALFDDYPAYKVLFENKENLKELFYPHPGWVEVFKHKSWIIDIFNSYAELAELFGENPTNAIRFLSKTEDPKNEWAKLFANDSSGKWFRLLVTRQPEIGEQFAPDPSWACLFSENQEWESVFSEHENVAELFAKRPDWFKLFLPCRGWVQLFESQKTRDTLINNFKENGEWFELFKDSPQWLELFAQYPKWAELFLRKPEYFELYSKDAQRFTELAKEKDWKWKDQFANNPEWAFVFAAELKEINERRKLKKQVDINKDLVGLAFSGGGIRSASFGLGVLEALRDFGLIKKIDYLSTVSGGGYIGAWLSANCKRAEINKVSDWLEMDAKEEWDRSISHLRRYSNYLSPKVGLFSADTWTMVTVWLRNTLLIQLMVVFGIAFLLLIPRMSFSYLFEWFPEQLNGLFCNLTASVLCAWSVAGISGNNLHILKDKVEDMRKCFVIITICVGLIALISIVYSEFNPLKFHNKNPDNSLNLGISLLLALIIVIGSLSFIFVFQKVVDSNHPERKFDFTQPRVQRFVVLPMLFVGFFVAAILWEISKANVFKNDDSYVEFLKNIWKYWPFPLSVAIVSLFFLSFSCIKDWNGKKRQDNIETLLFALLAPVISSISLYVSVSAIMFLLQGWVGLGAKGVWLAFVWAPSLVLFAFSFSVLIFLGLLGRDTSEEVREWWSRMGAWLAIYGFSRMAIVTVAIYGPLWSAILCYDGPWQGISAGWIVTTLAGLSAGKSASTGGVGSKGISTKLKDGIAKLAPVVFIIGLFIVVSTILHLTISINSNDSFRVSELKLLVETHWDLLGKAQNSTILVIFIICLVCLLLLSLRVDINEFSLNAFYRSRLTRCFLGATRRQVDRNPQNFTGFDDKDDLSLSDLMVTSGPFHIVNCALNLGGSSDLELHTRQSAIFTLTPFFFGSSYKIKGDGLPDEGEEIGYTNTCEYHKKFSQPTLGQAIAVSGAAANPNMGYHTSPVTAFMMTLFNVRLGWWFPNPHIPGINRPSPSFSLWYLIKELFGSADENSKYLSISDGGHFENLAAYELVKRKCKVIIISDAECDPKYQFEGLGTLIRMCEVDFKAKIKIDVRSICPDGESPWSRSRCAVGKIIYDYQSHNKSEGTLIYIKASMNGHEDTAIMQYKAANSNFPHESTGDQFYGEDQFESYRSLGREITKRTFDPVLRKINLNTGRYTKELIKEDSKAPDIIECAKKLHDIWSPVLPNIGQFSRHADQLMKLWSDISENQSLKSLDEQLNGHWPKSIPEGFRSEFYLFSQLIQLMENVYLDLDLEETWEHPDNEGWRTLFIQWASSKIFQETWKMTNRSYGLRFRYFCELHLPICPTERQHQL